MSHQKHSNKTSKKVNLITQAIISALAITPLWLSAAEENANETDVEVDEIMTVTAQKRVQNIMKVPVTVDSVSNEDIKQSGSIELNDIDKFIPGFEFGEGTQAGVSMRGVSSPNISAGGDPSTAIFFDGVYLPRAAQNVMFSDMERVEVLKGPQGTLFGKNAAMGVVNMVPNAPHDDFEAFAKVSLGTDKLQRFEGMANFAITDNLYFRVNALSNTQDGFAKNVAESSLNTGEKVWDAGEKDHQSARAALKWDISSRTNVQLSYDWDQWDQAPAAAIGISPYAENPTDPFAGTFANDVVEGGEARDMDAITFKLNHEFNDQWSMKLTSSYRDWSTNNRQDEDGTQDVTRYLDTNNLEDSDIFYNELQVNYNTEKFNYVGGVTYSKEKVHQTTFINTTSDTVSRLTTGDLNGQVEGSYRMQIADMFGMSPEDVPQDTVDYFMGLDGLPMDHMWNADEWANTLNALGIPIDAATILATNGTPYDTYDMAAGMFGSPLIFGPTPYAGMMWSENFINNGEFVSYGIYSDFDFQITDKWNVFFGVRYSEDKKDFSWEVSETQFAEVRPGVTNVLFPARDEYWQSKTWNKTTGRIGTGYIINDDHMVFASVATGYKAGGFDSLNSPHVNDPFASNAGELIIDPDTGEVVDASFDPEESLNYEIGYKGLLFEEITTTLALFHNVLDDKQEAKESKPPGQAQALPTIVNEDWVVDGLELGMNWAVSDSFSTGFVTEIRSTDKTVDEFYNSSGELIPAGSSTSDTNTSYTLLADWMPDIGTGFTTLHIDYVFRENGNASLIGEAEWVNELPGYFDDTQLLNARWSWINDDETIEVAIWGKNLLDNRYYGAPGGRTADLLGTGFTGVNRGLEAGIDFQYSF